MVQVSVPRPLGGTMRLLRLQQPVKSATVSNNPIHVPVWSHFLILLTPVYLFEMGRAIDD